MHFLKSLPWQNRAHFENFTSFFSICLFFLMRVTRQRSTKKKSSPRTSPYYIFLVFNLTLFHCSYLFKYFIVTICTIINTKKVKAGNLADKNRHSAGRGGGGRKCGLTTVTFLTGTCY